MRGLKNKSAVGNDVIVSEVWSDCRPWCQYSFPVVSSLACKQPIPLMHVVIIPLLKCNSKDPTDVNNYRPIAIDTALS